MYFPFVAHLGKLDCQLDLTLAFGDIILSVGVKCVQTFIATIMEFILLKGEHVQSTHKCGLQQHKGILTLSDRAREVIVHSMHPSWTLYGYPWNPYIMTLE